MVELTHTVTMKKYALKASSTDEIEWSYHNQKWSFWFREIRLKSLSHPNCIRSYGSYVRQINVGSFRNVFVFYTLFDLGSNDLQKIIEEQDLTIVHHKFYMKQILLALVYLKGNGILHGDLKPGNILLEEHNYLRVCDFGASSYETETSKDDFITTLYVRSPEQLIREVLNSPASPLQKRDLDPKVLELFDYDSSVDMWALACIFPGLL